MDAGESTVLCSRNYGAYPLFPTPHHVNNPNSSTHLSSTKVIMLASSRRSLPRQLVGSRYKSTRALNSLTPNDLAHFSRILPPASILSTFPPSSLSPTELDPFNNDWMGRYHGKATTVLKPKTTQEVSEIVKWCSQKRIGIVPQGGNTGLVGGSVPLNDEVILSLANMNTVRSFDPISGYSHCQSNPRLCIKSIPVPRYIGRRCRLHSPVSDRLCCAS